MLLDAISRGRLYQVKFLLDNKIENVNKTDENGQSCLMKAIFLSDKLSRTRYKIVQLLLKNGAEVNYVDKHRKSALLWASWLGKDDLVRLILREGIVDLDLNTVDLDGNTALHLAAMKGHADIVRMIIKAFKRFGLNIDRKNFSGMTPILAAVEKGQGSCVEVLVTEGDGSLTARDPKRFLNAQEWAQEKSLLNLSRFIASKSPTLDNSVSESRSQSPKIGKISDDGDSVEQTLDRRYSCKQLEADVGERINSQNSDVKHYQRNNASVDMFDTVGESYTFNNETKTSHLQRRNLKASSNAKYFSQSSDATMTNLFSLYAIQNTQNYRKGYDLSSLPSIRSYLELSKNELPVDDFDQIAMHNAKDLRNHNATLMRRRFSSISSLDSTGLVKRSSNNGFRKEGRKVMMVNAFSAIVPERRRRVTLAQASYSTPVFNTELDTKKSYVSAFQEKFIKENT